MSTELLLIQQAPGSLLSHVLTSHRDAQGFICMDHMDELGAAKSELSSLAAEGKISYLEDIQVHRYCPTVPLDLLLSRAHTHTHSRSSQTSSSSWITITIIIHHHHYAVSVPCSRVFTWRASVCVCARMGWKITRKWYACCYPVTTRASSSSRSDIHTTRRQCAKAKGPRV